MRHSNLKFGILKIAPVLNLYPESQVTTSYIVASAPAYMSGSTIGGELTHTSFTRSLFLY